MKLFASLPCAGEACVDTELEYGDTCADSGRVVFLNNHNPTLTTKVTLHRELTENGIARGNSADTEVVSPLGHKQIGCTVVIDKTMPQPVRREYNYTAIDLAVYLRDTPQPQCSTMSCPAIPPQATATEFPPGAPVTGSYQIQSINSFGPPVQRICIETRRDDQSDGGRLQQMDCRRNGQTTFHLAQDPSTHTYTIRTFVQRLLSPKDEKDAGLTDILGLGDTQLCPPGCVHSMQKARWILRPATAFGPNKFFIVNQGTGHCLQMDGSDWGPEGTINAIQCRATGFEVWTFIPL